MYSPRWPSYDLLQWLDGWIFFTNLRFPTLLMLIMQLRTVGSGKHLLDTTENCSTLSVQRCAESKYELKSRRWIETPEFESKDDFKFSDLSCLEIKHLHLCHSNVSLNLIHVIHDHNLCKMLFPFPIMVGMAFPCQMSR